MNRAGASERETASGRRLAARLLFPAQAALAGCAVLLSVWGRIPWMGTLGLGLLGASALAAALVPAPVGTWVSRWSVATAWVCTLVVPATLLLSGGEAALERYLDPYYAVLAWLIAAAVLPTTFAALEPRSRLNWKLPVMIWAFFGGILWLGAAYRQNQTSAFYIGLLINLALLVLWKVWFRLPGWAIQSANTLILILVGFPSADLLFHPFYRVQKHPEIRERLYSYEAGNKNPIAYATWWDAYLREVDSLEKDVLMPDPDHYLPYRLKPDSRGMLFQSHIAINSLGFRGSEIPKVKGNTYRIVALGESTTFGITLNPEDRPWPELLEQMIRERLKPNRPVEVINAGVPGYALNHNIFRFAKDILPLHPDLLLSYHGINGFPMLNPVIPSNLGPPPPRYKVRPVRFLADCEYHLKLLRYRQRQAGHLKRLAAARTDPLTSTYAENYRRLIGLARTNHFRLALGTFSMAVNTGSDPKIIRFYQVAYPFAPLLIEANAAHSQLVRALVDQYPDVSLVDTRPHLDGECERFLDLVHFAPSGDQQLAENFFNGIQKILEDDLGSDSPQIERQAQEQRHGGGY